jgi:hypothetical protein
MESNRMKLIFSAFVLLSFLPLPAFAQEKKEEAATEKTEETAAPKTEEKKPADNPGRYAPDFCDFEITFPEAPAVMKKCIPGADCYDLHSYTMVYDLQTTVDVSAVCNPSTPANYKRYTEGVMKAALAGMVEDRNLTEHQVKFTQEENVRSAALTGVGITGSQNKIYTGQLWIGQNSVFTVQAELIGGEHAQADKVFSEILQSIKIKPGKQLPKKPKASSIPSGNQQ